jgi:hypothetical protein
LNFSRRTPWRRSSDPATVYMKSPNRAMAMHFFHRRIACCGCPWRPRPACASPRPRRHPPGESKSFLTHAVQGVLPN